jgi:hypothetical protein
MLLVLTLVSAIAVAGGARAAARGGGTHKAKGKKPSCTVLVSLAGLREASDIDSLERKYIDRRKKDEDVYWTRGLTGGPGSLPGSACVYGTSAPGSSYTQGLFGNNVTLGYVVVGYGQSESDWKKLTAARKANGCVVPSSLDIPDSGIDGHGKATSVHLGKGSQAFVIDFDLVASGNAEPMLAPQFPEHFYVLIVRSRHGNAAQIAVYGATRKATEALAERALKNPKF